MKAVKGKKVEPCKKLEPETKGAKDCRECFNLDGEIEGRNGIVVSVSCTNRGKVIKIKPPEPEQLTAIKTQRVIPDKKILELGHKVKDDGTSDIFDKKRQSKEVLKTKNLNLF